MLNQVILVGRIGNIEKGEKTKITLAIPRSFKNSEGEYDTDFIDIYLYGNIAENTINYCKKGDIIGIKGRVQSSTIERYHSKMTIIEIIAEKVTFLTSKSE